MIFNSLDFIAFFLIVLPLHFLVPGKFRWILLLLASYFFYMYWEVSYIFLILASTGIDYFVSRRLLSSDNQRTRKRGLYLSIVSNLGLLFVFKYYNFFQGNVEQLCDFLGIAYTPNTHELLLPVGISFYTFQTLSYTIDVYRREIPPESHLGKFALYVSFFPQLVAGPIERAKTLLPQLKKNVVRFESDRFVSGFSQAAWGFFKKAVVADTVALQVDAIYNNYEFYPGATLLLATYLFAIQIYCDFSGYSDIAIGIARIMGYDIRENFNLPYFSKNVTEFWRRWHISLSSWLRDYLYIPLGGNRKGKARTYINLMLTMLLGGLWHGASWNYVIWGGLNGMYLGTEKLIKPKTSRWTFIQKGWMKPARVFLTFNLICLTWIFFRAESWEQSTAIIKGIASFEPGIVIQDTAVFANLLVGVFFLIFIEFFWLRKYGVVRLADKWGEIRMALFSAVMFILILLFGVSNGSQFIYFQF